MLIDDFNLLEVQSKMKTLTFIFFVILLCLDFEIVNSSYILSQIRFFLNAHMRV